MEKVKSFKSDVVVLDLEDSIAKEDKEQMRQLYLNTLRDKIFGPTKVFIRSSSLSCINEVQKDIATFTGSGIDGFLLPKLNSEDEVIEVERLITAAEKDKCIPIMQTKLIPIIETLPAYFALERIASASERNVGIVGGSGDFTAESLCEDHSATYNAYFSKCVLAARSAGILPLWGVHDKIDDHAGFYNVNSKMKACGFAGTAALTTKQIVMANAIYSLSPKEMKWIESVQNNGTTIKLIQPSVQQSRQMIGPPHRDKAENMLKQYVTPKYRKNTGKSSLTRASKGLSPGVKIGEMNFAPSESVITDGTISTWNSSFLQYSSNASSVPFSLSATLAVAFSVQCFSYYARAHLGFKNIFQARPLVPGDKVRGMFRIDDVLLKKGGDGNSYAVAKSKHWLVDQRDKVVLQLEKVTMFQPDHCSPKSAGNKTTTSLEAEGSAFFSSLVHSTHLPPTPSPVLLPGDVIVHDIVKVMGHSEVRMLCYLLRIVNPHHHNTIRYNSTDILVPGPFIMAAAMSSASPDLGEVVYEDISSCINPNKVNLGDQIAALTFIESCTVLESNADLEEVVLKHIAVKNVDTEVLARLNIPNELFSQEEMKPSEYENLCIAELPMLIHKIVCVVTRRIIRVRSGLRRPGVVPHELN